MKTNTKSNSLYVLANEFAMSTEGFFETKGPGSGNNATNSFINSLGTRAINLFGADFSEARLCGDNAMAVDFYFPDEGTIVEIALGLKNPNTEFEKDILKAVIAKSMGHRVERLLFISKPGGSGKCRQPGRQRVRDWLEDEHSISTEVLDLGAAVDK